MGSWSLVFFVGNEWIFPGMTHFVKGFSYFVQLKVCIENNLPNHRLCSKNIYPTLHTQEK
jgi:hypothetical protein